MGTLDDVLLGAAIIASLIFVPWVFLIRPWLRRRQAASADRAPVVGQVERRERWSLRGELARLFLVYDDPPVMPSGTNVIPFDRTVADRLPATSTHGGQGIAKPANAVNTELPGNALPEEVRAIIRFQQQVEDTVRVIQSGKIGQTEAIEMIFVCKRSGRADSVYGRAHAAVQAQIAPARRELVGDMIERINAEVAAEH